MIEFNTNRIRIVLDFSFFAVLAFCFFLDNNGILLMSVAAMTIHELGHLIAMLISDIRISSLHFYGAGIKIGGDIRTAGIRKSIRVLSAGVVANMIACLVSLIAGSYYFAAVNLVIGAFNLLCIGDLDGKQLVLVMTELHRLPEALVRLSGLLSYSLVILISIFCGSTLGFTFYLTLIYMLLIR